jgi:large subunit ribosomal protein L12
MTKVDPYLHAVLLLHGAGKEISEKGIVDVLKAAGAEHDAAKAKVLAEAVKGANFEELLKNATVVATAPVAAAAGPAGGAESKKEKPVEDEGKKEEQAAAGLSSLFG